jgi:putative iron-regulated protein
VLLRTLAVLAIVTLIRARSAGATAAAGAAPPELRGDTAAVLATYGEVAHRNYRDAYESALRLQAAVGALVATPRRETLDVAREAWLASRPSYGQSEAFRFYGGPIDAGKRDDFGGAIGLEGLLNAWPLDEAYIDSVRGRPTSGIVNEGRTPITRELLIRRNARDDEADVTTGYHAIEFLLWGQDVSPDGPGDRPFEDFVGHGAAERRRTYLKVTTDLLVDNLKTLVAAWAPDQRNYRALMRTMNPGTGIRNALTGIATLSGFELASERLATALDSGSQEDEQSCFSDSTHVDIVANAVGIENVYFGRYGDFRGAGLDTLVAAANPDLDRHLGDQIRRSVALARDLDHPFDRTLASPPGSPARAKVEALVQSLQIQADLLKQAAAALGVPITIGGDAT